MASKFERGKFIVLIGPDGVGKTSLAAELCQRTGGKYFHYRPPIRGPWPLPNPGSLHLRERRARESVFLSIVRLGLSWSRFWLAYTVRVRPEIRRGGWVVGDRWAYGYLARPRDLRYVGPVGLARWALTTLPTPDLVAALVAPPAEIVRRKSELQEEEVKSDIIAWLNVPGAVRFNATKSINQLADEVLEIVTRTMARKRSHV